MAVGIEACLLFGMLLAEPRATEAESIIVALPLRIRVSEGSDPLPETWTQQLQGRLVEGLARDGGEVVAGSLPAGGEDVCDAACIVASARDRGASWVAVAEIVVRGRDFDVALTLHDAVDGRTITKAEGTCEVCAVAEVGDMLADHAGVVNAKLVSLATAPPVVRFDSAPAGASIAVDGRLVGTAPIEHTVEPGRHRATATLSGYVSREQLFDAIAGTHETVRFELAPVPKRARNLRPAGWASLVAGVVLAGVGGGLLAIDGQPYRRRCDGTDVDLDGDCRLRYDTLAGGSALVAVGAASIVTGIVLLVVDARRQRKRGSAGRRAAARR